MYHSLLLQLDITLEKLLCLTDTVWLNRCQFRCLAVF